MKNVNSILKVKQYPLSATFGLQVPPQIMVPGYEISDPQSFTDPETQKLAEFLLSAVPVVNPMYQFRRELMRDFNNWYSDPSETDPLLLFGGTGTGKSSLVCQVAARLGVPVFRVTCSPDMELTEIFGHYALAENGSTVWLDGPAPLAAMFGGILLMDEVDRLRPAVAVGLNGLLEGGAFTLAGKKAEIVVPQPGYRIVCTANSNLAGDESGLYNTSFIMDKSFLDRFVMVETSYPSDEEEGPLLLDIFSKASDKLFSYWMDQEGIKIGDEASGVVKSSAQITRDDLVAGFLRLRKMIREQSRDGGNNSDAALERTMSTRVLIRWARYCLKNCGANKFGQSALHYALDRALGYGCNPTTRVAIHSMVKSVFGVDETL